MKKVFSFLGGIGVVALCVASYTFAYTQEQHEAYQWAYQNKITTQSNIQMANLNGRITRQALSKMIVNYLENVAGVKGTQVSLCAFTDENKITNDLKYYTKKVCGYSIMGTNKSAFKPTQPVNRAQLGTVLSRVLWGDEYNAEGKGYYVYHLNALKQKGVMNDIKNPKDYATRGDVLIILKRMSEGFGTSVYLNGNSISAYNTTLKKPNNTGNKIESSSYENEYISELYSNSNVIYTGKNGTKYYYDYKFLNMLKNAAEKKGESDLVNYLEIEAEYFKDGLDQLANLSDEEMLKAMGIDIDNIDPDNMTDEQKQEVIKKFKTGFSKIIKENKDKNNETLKKLEKVTKNISNDKFGLKEKYKKTKAFMEASNTFLDLYSESMFSLIEIALKDDETASSEEGAAQAFGLIGVALAYQGEAEEYQKYVEEWGVSTLKLLGIN